MAEKYNFTGIQDLTDKSVQFLLICFKINISGYNKQRVYYLKIVIRTMISFNLTSYS